METIIKSDRARIIIKDPFFPATQADTKKLIKACNDLCVYYPTSVYFSLVQQVLEVIGSHREAFEKEYFSYTKERTRKAKKKQYITILKKLYANYNILVDELKKQIGDDEWWVRQCSRNGISLEHKEFKDEEV